MKLRDKNCDIHDIWATFPDTGRNFSVYKIFEREFSPRQVSSMRSRPDFLSFGAHKLSEVREGGRRGEERGRGKERKEREREGKRGKEREREGKRGKEREREGKRGKEREREGGMRAKGGVMLCIDYHIYEFYYAYPFPFPFPPTTPSPLKKKNQKKNQKKKKKKQKKIKKKKKKKLPVCPTLEKNRPTHPHLHGRSMPTQLRTLNPIHKP